ncbi:hypothetical protein M513_13461 [Trichuris suis]|uniref:Uncharacterized protein n=1 Tax=Trichuris suis TaxID=68888 RepID=A0A085LL12_9BILA|nr:hypothetical protein M513_13461 [Trichuris suis]
MLIFMFTYLLASVTPQLMLTNVQTFFIAFPSTYLVGCGFSKAAALTKSRNRMDVATRGDLRLSLSNLQPDIMKPAKKCQPQGSH